MKPKLYFPIFADVPADLNALRPWTNAALCCVSILLPKRAPCRKDGSRHQGGSNGLEQEGDRAESAVEEADNATAQGKETESESASGEEEGNKFKGEHEAGLIIVLL